jgi:mediator of RNA polymerase II transcription subunit 14
VELNEKLNNPNEMTYTFYLTQVTQTTVEDNPAETNQTVAVEGDVSKMYLKLQSMIEFDTFVATHGPGTAVDGKCRHNCRKP